MSQRQNNRKNTKPPLGQLVTVLVLLVLVITGLVSTTFSTFVPYSENPQEGSLVAQIMTSVVNRSKEDIASTGADTYYLAGTMNGWNTTSTPMTQGTDTNGQTFYYSGYYSNQEQFKVVKNGSTWLGHEKNSSSVYPNSLSMYQYGSSGNCWPGSGGYYVVYNPTQDKISCVTVLPLKVEEVVFEVGDVVYFDIRNNTEWLTADATSTMYIQFNNSTTGSTSSSDRAQLTQIGTYLYMYKFTSECKSTIRFWRGNSSSMWNYSKSLSPDNGNGVYITSGGWSSSGTEATFSLTSIETPALSVSPASINLGETTTLSSSTTNPTIKYKIGSTEYTTSAVSGDIKYTFKNGSTALNTASATASYTWKPTAAGTYSTYVTITSTATGLSATSSAKTVTVINVYNYTVTYAYGGTVSPTSGSVVAGESVEIMATPYDGYSFAEWAGLSKATIGSTTSASTTLTPTADGATVQAKFRPDAPSALTLTGSNVATGTTGDGTENNPFIVFENSSFTLTAKATVVTGSSAQYCTTANGTYSTTNKFTPAITTKGVDLSYTVYAKAYITGYYSTNYKSATAHYMVFSHLNGANTGFSVSSNSITDADTLTLSGAYVNGVADAEKAYITQTYQVSTDNSTFSDISGTTWTPDTTGTYYFRVKTTNTKTGETVYSTSKSVTVIQSTVYYDITVTNAGTVAGTVKLYADGVEIKNNQILSNSALSVSLTRPNNNYYIQYLEVDGQKVKVNLNGDITKLQVIDHVKANVSIKYSIALKPKVTVDKPANASSISFKYFVDGVEKTATAAGEYYVGYGSTITYSVTPSTGYYVSEMTGVNMGAVTSSTVTGTMTGVDADTEVSAKLTKNNTVTVNVDTASDVTTGGSMTIDSTAVAFGTAKSLNYGAEAEVVITPPERCYAVVSGSDITPTIGTDGRATFSVVLTGANKTYTVKFVSNPKIYMVQPQYGSVYVTSGSGNNIQYYFNGDSVGYGTELTVHAKVDHANAKLNRVLVNDASIGTADGSKFIIYADSTATADITVDSKFTFAISTAYGTRRIFYTDTFNWGNGNVYVHPSTTSGDTNITSGSIKMTQKYYNEYNQYVYYADIPYSAKYVTFYNNTNTSQKTAQGTIANNYNAFYAGNTSGYPGPIYTWVVNYSDYVATDRADTIQQGVTVKDEAATFAYTCDYGDDTLSAEVVDGNAATVDFYRGVLSITPTENAKAFTLVKVASAASGTVKYYLVRVENFEITGFSGLQKIYNSQIFNNIQLDLIVEGGVLNFAAKMFVSDNNYADSYIDITSSVASSGFEEAGGTLQGYINSFLIEYQINSISGVKYYKVEATDGANHKATKTLRTLFGTNTYNGTRCVYFYNNTGNSISKYDLRACFNNSDNTNHRFVTMQQVGETNYYRAVVPNGYDSSVNFYLTNAKTFSNNYVDYDGSNDTVETYYYGVMDAEIPTTNDANIVYQMTEISDTEGIKGEFTTFDY